MNKKHQILAAITLLLMINAAAQVVTTTTNPDNQDCITECATRGHTGGYCWEYPVIADPQICEAGDISIGSQGSCATEPGMVGFVKTCCCTPTQEVPEYTTLAMLVAALLTAPAIAYLINRRKK